MNKKIVGSDILRCFAMLFVVIYHIWSLGGTPKIEPLFLNRFVMLGGEIGVTLFFVLSGFGIYFSLANMEKQYGKISPAIFWKKRCIRILPQYYIHLFLILTIGPCVGYVSREYWMDVLPHIFFMHNFWGGKSINLVLWTIEITVQFYIVAIPLYYFLKRYSRIFLPLTIILTIISKCFVYMNWMLENQENAFLLGRQTVIFTVLDNFTMGMFIAFILEKRRSIGQQKQYILISIISVALLSYTCEFGQKYGIHTNNWSGYIFHSLLALNLALILYAFSHIKWNRNAPIVKVICLGAKYEYGIYLYHIVFIENYLLRCGWIMELQNKGWYIISYFVLGVLSIGLGSLMNMLVDSWVLCIRQKK